MSSSIPPEILALPAEQRMELAAQIWDSVRDEAFRLSDEHRRVLDERLDAHLANPEEGETWEAVRKQVNSKEGAS